MPTNYNIVQLPSVWGLNTLDDALKSPLRDCRNVRFNADGTIERVQGYTAKLDTVVHASAIVNSAFAWHRQKTVGGDPNDKKIFACNGVVYMLTENEDNVETIQSGFNAAAQIRFASYGDYLYYGNGTENNYKYAEGATSLLGIDFPSSSPTVTHPPGGALAAGTYQYAYSYYSSTTSEESGICTPTSATVSVNDQGALTNIANSSDSQVTHKRIYRTTVNGTSFYLVDTISSTTTTYNDVTADADLGALNTTEGYERPFAASIMLSHNNRMYYSGNKTTPQRIQESDVFIPSYIPTDDDYYRDVDVEVTALIAAEEGLIACEKHKTWLYSGESFANSTKVLISAQVGCQNADCVTYLKSGQPVWFTGSELVTWDGSSVSDLSPYVRPSFTSNLNDGTWDLTSASMMYCPSTNIAFLFFRNTA